MSELKRKLLHLVESDEEESENQPDKILEEESDESDEQLYIPSDEDLEGWTDQIYNYSNEEEDTSASELKKTQEPRELKSYTKFPSQTAVGGAYRRTYIHQEYMISKGAKNRAEIIREHQLQGPSEELLRSIYMLTAHRCYEVKNIPDQNLFRQSALFALGVLVEEMAKHAARKEVDTECHKQDKSMAGDMNDEDNRDNRKRKTGAKKRRT